VIMRALSTSPTLSKSARKSSSFIRNERFPTNKVVGIEFLTDAGACSKRQSINAAPEASYAFRWRASVSMLNTKRKSCRTI
jgi:hypothetical protein